MANELEKNPNITIVGGGNIGWKLLQTLRNQYPDSIITVANRESDRSTGGAISTDQDAGIASRFRRGKNQGDGNFIFTNDEEKAMTDADIVVITAGASRKSATQPRTDLAKDNIPVIDPIAEKAGKVASANPEHKATYIIATNPVGLIDQRFAEISGIPHEQIMGLSGELDVERLRQSLRLHLHLEKYEYIRGERVLGDHGPNMVPVLSQIEVYKDDKWQKLLEMPEYKSNEALQNELKDATVKGGGKLTKWSGQSDFRGPASAIAYMVEQVVDARWGDKSASLPITASTFVPEAGVYSGQTIRINKDGTHSPAEMPAISADEQAALQASIEQAQKDKKGFDALARLVKETGMDDARSLAE